MALEAGLDESLFAALVRIAAVVAVLMLECWRCRGGPGRGSRRSQGPRAPGAQRGPVDRRQLIPTGAATTRPLALPWRDPLAPPPPKPARAAPPTRWQVR